MAKQVTAYNSYDSERSRLTLGVTNTGTPFAQLTEIFEAYIGKKPEKGAKVYNPDRNVFFPLPIELLLEVEMNIEALEAMEEGEAEVSAVTENQKRSWTFGRNVDEDTWYSRMVFLNDEDEQLEIEHLFQSKETDLGNYHFAILAIKEFIKDAKRLSFNLDSFREDYENQGSGSSENKPAGLAKKPSKLGGKLGGGNKPGGKTPPPKRSVTSEQVADMLEDDE